MNGPFVGSAGPQVGIPVHDLPPNTLFRVFMKDGTSTRAVLWFKCSPKGDLVTRSLSSSKHVHQAFGGFHGEGFKPTSIPQPMPVSGNDDRDHLHLTVHPSSKKHPSAVLNGVLRQTYQPVFDPRTLSGRVEVATHLLGSPNRYPQAVPDLEKPDGKFHAVIGYSPVGLQPKLTFWVAPINRCSGSVADLDLLPGCFMYARTVVQGLPHDLLTQVQLNWIPLSQYGDMHIMAAPIVAG